MSIKYKAITPAVLISLANTKKFAKEFAPLCRKILNAPGVAYPCCETTEQTIEANNYWNNILLEFKDLPKSRIDLIKSQYFGGVDKLLVRCKNNGRSELYIL